METLIMQLAIPAFILFMLFEYFVGRRKKLKLYDLSDTITNLNIGIGSQIVGLLSKGFTLLVFFFVYDNFAFFNIESTVFTFLVCLVLYDFIFYWAHRWGHEISFFWGAHVVHHQSEEYNLSVALRQPWFHSLISFFLFLPIPLLGFHPVLIFSVSLFSTLYQFWIHTKAINRLPSFIEYIFNTPSHHRVHHAVNPKYLDKNHGGVFIIWDRIFGTFQKEEEAPIYGITTQFKSLNPLWANISYYIEEWKNLKGLSLINKVKAFLAPPGSAKYHTIESNDTDLNREKFQVDVPIGLRLYSLAQFAILALGLIAYMTYFETFDTFLKIYFAFLIVLSLVISGGILEKKKWVFFAEYARLLSIGFTLSIYYYFAYIEWFNIMLVSASIVIVGLSIWFSISLKKNYKMLLLDSY